MVYPVQKLNARSRERDIRVMMSLHHLTSTPSLSFDALMLRASQNFGITKAARDNYRMYEVACKSENSIEVHGYHGRQKSELGVMRAIFPKEYCVRLIEEDEIDFTASVNFDQEWR